MIAVALACNPKVLLADEPTTALDVTIQAQILELMNELQEKLGTSIVLITHDMGVVAKISQKVTVLFAGRVIEDAATRTVFENPAHPYTQALIAATPTPNVSAEPFQPVPAALITELHRETLAADALYAQRGRR